MRKYLVETEKQEKYFWVRYIKRRIKKNKNFLCMISGPTGSGKSWSALSIAEMLNKDFNIVRVIFKGKELMTQINSEKYHQKKGIVLVWDEAGIDLSSRNWQSLTNKMLNFLLQSFRHRCFILFFTAPYSSFLDKSTRKLFHAEFKTVSIDFDKRIVRLRPQLIQYNSRLDKFYYKFLKIISKKEGIVPVREWGVPAPSEKLVEDYERKKNLFTATLNAEIEIQLNKLENKKGLKPLTELQERILNCWGKGITKQKEIATLLGKDQPQISDNVSYMRNKGYSQGN